ncbi:MAG: hypothetical protein ABIN99_00760 [Nitrosospira sp.]
MNTSISKTEELLLKAFRRAASDVPGYRVLLREHGVEPDKIVDITTFSHFCPLLTKKNTFARFPLEQLCAGGKLGDLAEVLTSSGHGGQFSFGMIDRKQASIQADFIDEAFDAAFHIKTRSTLAINCLPMGVGFSSRRMTIATTSVREDMAVALVQAFGHNYEQIILIGDPLFMKKFTEHATMSGVDWGRYRTNVVMGEEVFGEHFRGYLAKCLNLNTDQQEDGNIISSFGVGELGLHLCYETPATIALRRAALKNRALARDLGCGGDGMEPPMIFTFNPLRAFIEIVNANQAGYGEMTLSTLNSEVLLPLLRYQTGDIACLLDPDAVGEVIRRHELIIPGDLPRSLLALRGRDKEALPNGSHVGFYKDILYADHWIAKHLTGACRLIFFGTEFTMHVQLARPHAPHSSLDQGISQAIPAAIRPLRVVLWSYESYPFGMGLDYERKFSYYVPGELPLPEILSEAHTGRSGGGQVEQERSAEI